MHSTGGYFVKGAFINKYSTVCLGLFPRDSRFRCSRTSRSVLRSASGGSERHNQRGPRASIQPPVNSIFSTELFHFMLWLKDRNILYFYKQFFVFTFIKHIYQIFNCLKNFESKFHSYRIKFLSNENIDILFSMI